jgi:voltage-gated potassium channel
VRNRLLPIHRWLARKLEFPLIVLGLVWLALLIAEMVRGESAWLTRASNTIWVVFVIEFVLSLATAPAKLDFLRRNWLSAVSLLLPALRILRVFRAARLLRAARFTRGMKVVRVLSRISRGLRSVSRVLRRRRFGYVAVATGLVALAGGAGMFGFEQQAGTFETFPEALWWTAMLLTTMGSEQWPRTTEGRALCLILSVYGFAVFGYLTAVLATWFIGKDSSTDAASESKAELHELRRQVEALNAHLAKDPPAVD